MNQFFTEIAERVSAFMDTAAGDFEENSQDLFALQYQHIPAYQKFCDGRGVSPQSGHTPPAIPTTAYRDYQITSLPENNRQTVFHSSGTTQKLPSRHFHDANSLALYEQSLKLGFNNALPNTPRKLALTPPPAQAPHSSLVHMLHFVQGDPIFTGIATPHGWQVDCQETVRLCQSTDTPVTIMGTAFSFVHLCDAIEPISLPAGSCVMETGGYKNQSRELPKADLHNLIRQQLGVPANNIHCEYGMCELSSQAYAVGQGTFQFPHWARARVISPETSDEVEIGETGLLVVFDLANVYSVQAIATGDLAVRKDDGFELIGRQSDQDSRGCSLHTSDFASPSLQPNSTNA